MHRRSLAEVQHPVLDAAGVGRLGHLPAKRVKLPHQMSLPGAADRRIARHISNRVQIDCEHDGFQSKPRAGQSGFNPGMTRPNHRHIIAACIKLHIHSLGSLK